MKKYLVILTISILLTLLYLGLKNVELKTIDAIWMNKFIIECRIDLKPLILSYINENKYFPQNIIDVSKYQKNKYIRIEIT